LLLCTLFRRQVIISKILENSWAKSPRELLLPHLIPSLRWRCGAEPPAGLAGFFWDDWPTIWYLHLLGPAGFRDVFTIDRPLLGWLFMVTTSVLGESTLAWQLFGLFTRWLCCLALWWLLRLVWPGRDRETAWAAFLFAVYPVSQQSISVITMAGSSQRFLPLPR
jgi:hypothetical protein